MKKLNYILCIVLGLFFSSCNHLEEGRVLGKRHEEATRTLMLMPMMCGKIIIMQHYWIYDDEDWVVTIEGEYEGELIRENVYISKECFEALNHGDRWMKTDDCSFSDNNNTRKRANKQ